MARGDPESGKCVGGVEEDDEDPWQGGGDAADVRIFIQNYHEVSVALWCRNVGGYPPHGTCTGGFPGLGGAANDGADPAAADGREVGVHLCRDSKSGGGV